MPEKHDTSQIKAFLRDAAAYAVSGVATTGIGIVMVPIYTRVFSPGEYGALDLIASLVACLILFLLMGQLNAVGRFYVDVEDARDGRLWASTSWLFVGAFALSTAACLLFFHKGISRILLGTTLHSTALALAICSVPFTVQFRFLQNLLKWRREAFRYAAVSIAALVIGLSVTIYLVVVARMGLTGVYLAAFINAIAFGCIALYLVRSSLALTFSFTRLSELLRYGTPFVPVAIAYYLITYSDRYLLRYLLDLNAVGIYAVGVRVSAVMTLMLNGFQMAMGPFIFSHYKDENAAVTFAKVFDYVSVAATMGVAALALFSADVVSLFATAAYFPGHSVVPLLTAGTAAYGLGAYFSFGIGIAKKTIHRAWTAILAAALNIALNLLLIPKLGVLGAASATACSFFTLAILQMRISQKFYKVPYRLWRNGAMYLAAVVVISIAYIADFDRPELPLIPIKIGLLGVVPATAVVTGLLTKRELHFTLGLVARLRGRRK